MLVEGNDPRKDLLKIGEISERAKIPVSKVRYYVDEGLVDVSAYTDGSQYLFDEALTLDRINHINELSKRGLTLQQVKEYILGSRQKKKIVVIDDEEDFARMIGDAIKKEHADWEVRVSTNVFDSGHVLTEFFPDLIVLDLFLPGVKGFEICKFVRSNVFLKHAKILSVSSHDTKKNREEITRCGADAFLCKNEGVKDILKKVDELLSKEDNTLVV